MWHHHQILNLNSATIFYTQFGAKLPNLKTTNILTGYKLHENMYQYYKSRKNPYQVLQVTRTVAERAMKSKVYDKIAIP